MKNRFWGGRAVVAVVWAAFAGAAAAAAAHGQIPGAVKPDVQVVVMPLPTGQWGISTVYPKQVSKAEADARLARLLAASHWKAQDIVFENGQLTRVPMTPPNDPDNPKEAYQIKQAAPAVMSSLTFSTSGNPVDLTGGTMVLEPFAQGFRDLTRVHVTYLVPKGFVFHGLPRFDNDDLSVDMMSGGEGAYTYVMNIKNHQLGNFVLPKTEPLSPARASGQTGGAAQKKLVGGGLVALIALIAGALVYLWAQKLGGPTRKA